MLLGGVDANLRYEVCVQAQLPSRLLCSRAQRRGWVVKLELSPTPAETFYSLIFYG